MLSVQFSNENEKCVPREPPLQKVPLCPFSVSPPDPWCQVTSDLSDTVD